MNIDNLPNALSQAKLKPGGNSVFHVLMNDQAGDAVLAVWNGTTMTLPVLTGYATGCLLGDLTNKKWYINEGTRTVAAFKQIASLGSGAMAFTGNVSVGGTLGVTGASTLASASITGALTVGTTLGVTGASTLTGAVALNGGATVATAKTIAAVDADAFRANGRILPEVIPLTFHIGPHATATEYNLFEANRAYEVVYAYYIMNIVDTPTFTLVKATVNATPDKTTTPLHTADSGNTATTVHNGTAITLLTAGAEDLAATNKIGIDFSAAMTAGDMTIVIGLRPA